MLAGAPVIALRLEGRNEAEVIHELSARLAGRPGVTDAVALEKAILQRQKIQPPCLGNGVALPHARTTAVTEMVMAIGRCVPPVRFGAEDAGLVFLYGVPPTQINEYLRELSALARLLKESAVIERLLAAPDEQSFRRILQGEG